VVQSGPRVGEEPPAPGSGRGAGAAIQLTGVVGRSGVAEAAGESGVRGVSFRVPPGQSVALLGQPRGIATELSDVIAGLSRPRAGQVLVDGVAVNRLSGAELDRYRARRGLVSPRFPLLPSLSVTDNVLAAPPAGRARDRASSAAPSAEHAAGLLELTGTVRRTGPVTQLTAEDQWRVMLARALAPSPRLLLAEDPASVLDQKAADRILDVLLDAHALLGFTLVLTAGRTATAARCQRRVLISNGTVVEDELTGGDDAWTRGRIDRIG
jgi:putative ABC transport system ATP-binding protein